METTFVVNGHLRLIPAFLENLNAVEEGAIGVADFVLNGLRKRKASALAALEAMANGGARILFLLLQGESPN